MTLTLTILGCASSGGVPRVGGVTQRERWGACDPSNPKNKRSRCSVLLTRLGPDGAATRIVVDTGPDFRAQMLTADVPHLDAVVYTHEHADHLHGLDDLRPFALIQKMRIPVYMNERTFERANQAFGYVFQTPEGSSYPPILERKSIDHDGQVSINGPGGLITLRPIPVKHGDIQALGFRIGHLAYVPDVSDIPQASLSLLEGLDCLILDALRYRPHGSHFNVERALEVHDQLGPKRTVLTNLHNDLDYETLLGETPDTVEPAYDGMQLDVR